MKKSFASRRAPKRIGDDSDSDEASAPVKRPPLVTKSSKRKSTTASASAGNAASRLSFSAISHRAPASTTDSLENAADADDDAGAPAPLPRRAGMGLSRIALERNAGKLPFRTGHDAERPSYDWETLKALQSSTPSTPLQVGSGAEGSELDNDDDGGARARGMQLAATGTAPAIIPSEAEIREKKQRRARLALEQEYVSLHGDDDEERFDGPQDVMLRDKEAKYGETRLVRDDEDFAEGFDEFVEDGQVLLGRRAERAQKQQQQRREMAALIARAERGGRDDGEDDEEDETDLSEAERNAEYEAAQTRHGTYARGAHAEEANRGPQVPAKITPVPDLAGVVTSLKAALQSARDAREATKRKLDELKQERVDVAEREIWVQAQLKEMGEKYAHVTNSAVPV